MTHMSQYDTVMNGFAPQLVLPLWYWKVKKADSSVYYSRVVRKPDYLENKYVVLYFGSVLPLHGVEVVLKSMDFLKNKEGLHFFFIEPISAKAYIYHAMGKPMILGDNPANHELFDGDNKVTFVEMGNMLLLIGF